VQLGTAFLACAESGAHTVHKEAVLAASDESTVLTRAVSGKHARGIRTPLLDELRPLDSRLPSYPAQNALTQGIRRSAAKAGNPAYMAMWAGQAASLAKHNGAAQIIEELVRETGEVLNRMSGQKL
ncbi:nitronate monooxygenase, partial [Paenibacillus chitinolyticus]|uniref:NAD(P)H-dependent flavin oxidoreductase n=1 Tax=Paenibacillus chitinolyticus TaxID=79263 RepID=UPI002DB5BEDA